MLMYSQVQDGGAVTTISCRAVVGVIARFCGYFHVEVVAVIWDAHAGVCLHGVALFRAHSQRERYHAVATELGSQRVKVSTRLRQGFAKKIVCLISANSGADGGNIIRMNSNSQGDDTVATVDVLVGMNQCEGADIVDYSVETMYRERNCDAFVSLVEIFVDRINRNL